MNKKTIISTIKYLLFTALAVFLVWWVFRNTDFSQLWIGLKSANYWWVAASLLVLYVSFYLRAFRWRLLMEPIGHQPSRMNSYHAVVFGYFANLLIPRFGEVARCGALNRTDKVPVDALFGTVVAERIIDVLFLLLLLISLFILKADFFGGFLYNTVITPLAAKLAVSAAMKIALLMCAVCFIALLVAAYLFRKRLLQISLFAKIVGFATGMLQGLRSVLKMKQRGWFIFYTLGIWSTYLFATYLVFFALPATSNLTLLDALFLLVAGSLGMVAPVQNGFGIFHGIIASALVLYGLDFERDGLLYATLIHESQLLEILICGLISFIAIIIIMRRNNATTDSK